MTAVAYLINQYPSVSHTFIRTEIRALEERGVAVRRIAMRGWDSTIVDSLDAEERRKTRYVLQGGALPLIGALAGTLLRNPLRFLAALRAAWKFSRSGERGLLYHLVYLAEACLVSRWLANDKSVGHIHAHFGSNATIVANLVRALGGPGYSFTVHGPEEFDKPLQWSLGRKIADAKFVAAITSFCRSQLFRWADPADWSKISIVHCALDPRIMNAPPAGLASQDTMVCVGRLCEQKGQLLLVEAVARLHARGIPMRLILAGDGAMRQEIEQAINAARLEDFVTITGWIGADEVRRLLDETRAMVLPSFAEGLPVVIMEAMARARPVITTYIAGIPELVRDGKEGFLVPAGDVDALSTALERVMMLNDAQLAAMGAAGRERVLERHSDVIEAAKLEQLFRRGVG